MQDELPSQLKELLLKWMCGRADRPLTFIDHFASDVVYTHSAIFHFLHEVEPHLPILWIHGEVLARKLDGRIPDLQDFTSLVQFGMYKQASDVFAGGMAEILLGAKTAFIVSFYESPPRAPSRSSSLLARALSDFFKTANLRGHLVVCCLPRQLLLIEPLERLFLDQTTALGAVDLYGAGGDYPSTVASSAVPDVLQRLFVTKSRSLTDSIESFLATLARPLSDMPSGELRQHLLELVATLADLGFYETAFRLEQWCGAANGDDDVIRLALDIYTKEEPPDGALTVGVVDNPVFIPEIAKYSCLTGSAGCGKSTTLFEIGRYWTIPIAASFKGGTSSWVPIRLENTAGGLATSVARYLGESRIGSALGIAARFDKPTQAGPGDLTLANLRWLYSSPILLLLDEFDKLDTAERRALQEEIEDFRNATPNASVVIAARTGHAPNIRGFTQATVRALSNSQGAAIIRKAGSSLDFGHLVDNHRQPLSAIVRNPFLLTMVCKTCDREEEARELTLSDLLRRYVKYLLVRGGNVDSEQDETVRECIQYWLPTLALTIRAGQFTSESAPPESHIEFARSVGILRAASTQSIPQFSHSLLQDYFVARRLHQKADKAGFVELLPSDKTLLEHWSNALRILAGLLEPHLFDALIAFLADGHLELALDCLSNRGSLPNTEAANVVVDGLCKRTQLFDEFTLASRTSAAIALGWMDRRIYLPAEAVRGMVKVSAKQGRRAELWAGRYPVTNMEYAEFIHAGGYETELFWTVQGWKWLSYNAVDRPLYWNLHEFSAPNRPVVGVSFHEALAYCRWLNSMPQHASLWYFQLPSDEDWAHVAFSPTPQLIANARKLIARYNQLEEPAMRQMRAKLEQDVGSIVTEFDNDLDQYREQLDVRQVMPVGVFSPNRKGVFDMFGQVWQWCDSWASTRGTPPSASERDTSEPIVVRGGPGDHRSPLLLLLGGWLDAGTRFDRLGFRIDARPTRKGILRWLLRHQR